jgi:hypothetical protein
MHFELSKVENCNFQHQKIAKMQIFAFENAKINAKRFIIRMQSVILHSIIALLNEKLSIACVL